MLLSKFIRDIQVKLEAIPNPSAIFYNAIVKKILSKSELKIAQDVVQKIDKGTLIDIGSGTGFLSIEIAKKAPYLNIYGIDLSKKMVEIASGKAKSFNNLKFKLANATNLPFKSESVEFIVSTGSFHHWKNPIKVFNECYRVLKDKKEAWIYDGCFKPPNEEVVKLKLKYGVFQYIIMSRIQKLHGFSWDEYKTKITPLLTRTRFKKNFQMVLTDGWMKLILRKIDSFIDN